MKKLTRPIGLAAVVLGLVFGGANRAKAGLMMTGTTVTVFEGGTGTFSFSVTNTGANVVDFTNLTGSISSLTGDTSDFGSAPFVINIFSVNPGATVILPFQVVTGAADSVSEPIDFGVSGYNVAITGKDRVTAEVFNVSANSFITVVDGPVAVPEPSSLALCGIAGLIGLAVARVRRKRL